MSKSLNFLACIITVIGLLPFIGRPKGVLGKSKLDGKKNEIQLFLNKGVSKSAIAKIMVPNPPSLKLWMSLVLHCVILSRLESLIDLCRLNFHLAPGLKWSPHRKK
jgi:hypothetical protein